MKQPSHSIEVFCEKFDAAVEAEELVTVQLSAYRGKRDLRKVILRPVVIRGEALIAVTYQFATRDTHENIEAALACNLLGQLLGHEFFFARLSATSGDIELDGSGKQGFVLREKAASKKDKPTLAHDREKNRSVPESRPFLKSVGIAGDKGILADRYSKYRQIDKFVEIVLPLIKKLTLKREGAVKVVDYGSGKHYLTFALYDALERDGTLKSEVVGIERRDQLVEFGSETAQKLGFSGLRFHAGEITALADPEADVVLALHACDTATDDALIAGIQAKAGAIVLAPCCHKYVRPRLKLRSELERVMSGGILEERFAALVSDGLRAQVLEAFGYHTRVFEFIDSDHTDRNIMITAVRQGKREVLTPEQSRTIKNLAEYYGLEDFYLDLRLRELGMAQ
jgi:hypothetical protein